MLGAAAAVAAVCAACWLALPAYVAGTLLAGTVIFNIWFIWGMYKDWKELFAGRASRGVDSSPSHHKRPHLHVADHARLSLTSVFQGTARRASEALVSAEKESGSVKRLSSCPENPLLVAEGTESNRMTRLIRKHWTSILMLAVDKEQPKTLHGDNDEDVRAMVTNPHLDKEGEHALDTTTRDKALDMDHVRISLTDYIWVHYMIGFNAAFLWISGISRMLLRNRLVRAGLMSALPVDHAELVAKLCLEAMEATRYSTTDIVNGRRIATFLWYDFMLLLPAGRTEIAGRLQVKVDLDAKRMTSAALGPPLGETGEWKELTPKQAAILVFFDTISAFHVKLHSYANWGLNVENMLNPEARRMAVVTVMYNHFGYHRWQHYAKMWYDLGLSTFDFSHIRLVFQHGIDTGLGRHTNLHHLAKDSTVVHFIGRLRGKFLERFEVHKQDFPGVDGEALFIGTVLHSLDHTLMGWNMVDGLWLDVTDPEYGLMAEVGRFVRAGFIDDLPGLPFNQRFKGANHPFYREVYEAAAKIDVRLADNMDTCIIK